MNGRMVDSTLTVPLPSLSSLPVAGGLEPSHTWKKSGTTPFASFGDLVSRRVSLSFSPDAPGPNCSDIPPSAHSALSADPTLKPDPSNVTMSPGQPFSGLVFVIVVAYAAWAMPRNTSIPSVLIRRLIRPVSRLLRACGPAFLVDVASLHLRMRSPLDSDDWTQCSCAPGRPVSWVSTSRGRRGSGTARDAPPKSCSC